ncbi:MAG TPA: Pycsar system effector family protein [Croceibacterium sp.]|jgi:hypothetical protein
MDEMAQQRANEPTPMVFAQDTVNALRTVQQLTLTLSQMADQKASILMGATFVVFSISISRALDGHLPWSLAVLAVFSFLSALLAVLAVMPSVSRAGKGPAANTNLFFFGHFAQMSEEEWIAAMFERLSTDEGLHRTMLRDMYQNGQVLYRRKYRYLGYAYRAFVLGLVATLVSFVIELAITR